jgi:hypothetical protein
MLSDGDEATRRRIRRLIEDAAPLLHADLSQRQGCTPAERALVTEDQGLAGLPASYDEFLALAGHDDPHGVFRALFGEPDPAYESLNPGDPEYSAAALANQLARDGGLDLRFHGNRLVFLQHEGYLVNFIDGTADDDPVHQLDETGRLTTVATSFEDWLATLLDWRIQHAHH